MYKFKGTITYWNPDPSDTSGQRGIVKIEGRQTPIEILADGALKRTGQYGICESSDVSKDVPTVGEKVMIPVLSRYQWRRGGKGKKRGFGFHAPCWIRVN